MGRIKCPSEVCTPSFFRCPFLSHFFLLLLLSFVLHFHLSNFFLYSMSHFPLSSSASFDFVSPFSSGPVFVSAFFYLSLPPFSFMPCSWHVAQNHINTLLPITHTRVQKTERGRERAAKNRLSTVTYLHAEKWAVSSCLPVFLTLTTSQMLQYCSISSIYPVSFLMCVFILPHFCHWSHTITQTLWVACVYRAVQPTSPVWWVTSTTRSVAEENYLMMRSLCFCASTVEKPTDPRLEETTMYALNTPRSLPPLWQPPPPPTRTTSLTPTTTLAKRG